MDPNTQPPEQYPGSEPANQSFQPVSPQHVQSAPTEPPAAPAISQPAAATLSKDPGQGMGITALVLSLLGLGLPGVIFGIIAIRKSKKAGFQANVLGLVGTILGAVSTVILAGLVLLTLMNFQGAQSKARDTMAVTRLNSTYSKLEEHYNTHLAYPKVPSASVFPGIDPTALQDVKGQPIQVADGSARNAQEAQKVDLPSSTTRYQYIPFDCGDTHCKGYILRTYIENPSATFRNPYVKTGLNNPN